MKDYDYATLAEYYDLMEDNESIASFNLILDNILKKYKIKSVLDMTCGTGVQSIYLHKQGYDITASDYSKEMVAVAQKKYSSLKFNVGDIRKAKFGKFDAVISIFNAIGHLTKKDFEKALLNISDNLKDKGYYIFDIFNLDFMKAHWRNYEFIDLSREVNNMKFVRFNNNKLDKNKGIMHVNQKIYLQKGSNKPNIIKERWDLQIYSVEELKSILESSGFEVVEFLDLDGNKLNKENSAFILTIARKR